MRLRTGLWLALVGAAALPAQTPAAIDRPGFDWEPLRRLPVLSAGRFKPFEAYARETITAVTGEEAPKRIGGDGREARTEALRVYCAWMFAPETERAVAQIAAPDAAVRRRIAPGRDEKSTLFTYDELAADRGTAAAVAAALGRPSAEWSDFERELLAVRSRMSEFAAVAGLGAPHGRAGEAGGPPCIPPRGGRLPGVEYRWGGIGDLAAFGHPAAAADRIRAAWSALGTAWRAADADRFRAASIELAAAVRALDSPEHPAPEKIDREVRYLLLQPFSKAAWLYFLSFWLAVLCVVWRKTFLVLAAAAPALVGLAFHVHGSIERTALSGQALIGNLYESLLFVAGAAVLTGLLFEVRQRRGWFLLAGTLLGWLAVRAALDNPLFMPPAIARLRPVLINNFWIHIHVPAIMASYATLGLSAVLAHAWLLLRLFKREDDPELQAVARFSYRLIPPGVVLLFAGMVLGGVWADSSWGRFWGWDPKETWSFITWLVYVLIVHGRFIGRLGDAGTAVGGVVGGLAILMTYYGVNFFLNGLHSYAGAGAGTKSIPTWLYLWLGFEVVLLGATWLRRRRRPRGPASPDPASAVATVDSSSLLIRAAAGGATGAPS